MTDDKAAESLLPYDEWTEEALRQVMVRALNFAAHNGLPGEHHFYVTFRTTYPGVAIPQRLLAQYPDEMTIVLQHQFWDLKVDEAARLFSVGLSFGGIPSTLVIPLDAVVQFADPTVRLGLRFRTVEPAETAAPAAPIALVPALRDATADAGPSQDEQPEAAAEPARTDPAGQEGSPKERTGKHEAGEEAGEKPEPQVVSLDAFRRRPPPKT